MRYLLWFFCAACAAPRSDVRATLHAQTQELLDAVSDGKPAVWQRLLDPDVTYVAEDGTRETRTSLVAQVKPFPAGISGTLKIASFDVHEHGDTATVVHDDHEIEQYFGQTLTSDYRTTDTWRRTPEGWRLIASQVHVSLADPPAQTLPAEQLAEYAGTYQLTPEIAYEIRLEGRALVGQRTGGKPSPLSVEVRDVLFVVGQQRSRKIFARDAAGKITGFADRRDGRDVVWHLRP